MQGYMAEPSRAPEGDAAVGAGRRRQAVLAAQPLAALGVHDPLQAELGEAPVHLRGSDSRSTLSLISAEVNHHSAVRVKRR